MQSGTERHRAAGSEMQKYVRASSRRDALTSKAKSREEAKGGSGGEARAGRGLLLIGGSAPGATPPLHAYPYVHSHLNLYRLSPPYNFYS